MSCPFLYIAYLIAIIKSCIFVVLDNELKTEHYGHVLQMIIYA